MKLLKIVVCAVALAGVVGVLSTEDSSAVDCLNNRLYCNSSEQVARNQCFSDGNFEVQRGVIWFNASGDAATDTGYYANTVDVDHDATSVQVNIRGSVFACGSTSTSGVYASRVKPGYGAPSMTETPTILQGDDYRLTNLSSTSLYRGVMPGAGHLWSSIGTEIEATLDVSGVATDNGGSDDIETFSVNLYRCFSGDGFNILGQCYSNPVQVRVRRAQVPLQYDLQPSIENAPSTVQPGGQIVLDGLVMNNGADDSPGNQWELTRVFYEPGANPSTTGGDVAADPCGHFDSVGRLTAPPPPGGPCAAVDGGTGTTIFPSAVLTAVMSDLSFTVPDNAEVGTRICFALSVRPASSTVDPNFWRHSNLHCVMVSKSPKLQVWGGDVRSGGKIDTSLSVAGSAYGSWGEYGVLSRESNSFFGSGAGLNNGNPISSQSAWSNLTFANPNDEPCTFGCYNFSLSAGGLVSQFIASASPATANLNDLESGTYQAGDIILTGTTISAGKTIIVVSTGTVTIDGSITYEDTDYTDIRNIPQVIIKAPVINIRGGATQVDAWLLAVNTGVDGIANNEDDNGILNTCIDIPVGTGLTSNDCNNRLMINGPVVADIIYLRRTAGSGSSVAERGDPAEIFNLRADAYLWANAYGSGTARVQTVYTKELSPRF